MSRLERQMLAGEEAEEGGNRPTKGGPQADGDLREGKGGGRGGRWRGEGGKDG